jgi:hypothetical protein
MAISNGLKVEMLNRLDPTKTEVGVGLTKVILIKRTPTGEEDYVADGIYGGYENISWAIDGETYDLVQDGELDFNIEQGVRIVGYKIIFDNGTTESLGAYRDLNEYIYDEDGLFTLDNITILLS